MPLEMLPLARGGVARNVLLSKEHLVTIQRVKHLVDLEDVLSFADELCKLLGLIATVFAAALWLPSA